MALADDAVDERRMQNDDVADGDGATQQTPERPEQTPNTALRPTPAGAMMNRRGRTPSIARHGKHGSQHHRRSGGCAAWYTQCISMGDAMQTRIQRWGNSLGLRIPKSFAAEAGVEAGSEVDLSVDGGDLVVKPARRRTYRLNELIDRVNAKNVHGEVQTGRPVGRESW